MSIDLHNLISKHKHMASSFISGNDVHLLGQSHTTRARSSIDSMFGKRVLTYWKKLDLGPFVMPFTIQKMYDTPKQLLAYLYTLQNTSTPEPLS